MKKIFTSILLTCGLGLLNAQISGVATTNGTTLTETGGRPTNCSANGFKLLNQAVVAGSCVSMTQNTFESGAFWACDGIDLNQNFRIDFEVNFDVTNSGDGIAFVLQGEGVPQVMGGEAGGLGYSVGNAQGCLGGDCVISPSLAVEMDIWDNSVDSWDFRDPSLGTINDVSCDHASMQVNGDQRTSGTIAGPNCLAATDVTTGSTYNACLLWDPAAGTFDFAFDGAIVTSYSGDIRSLFPDPSNVFWGFTAGSGGANQNLDVCNIVMNTGLPSPPPSCLIILSMELESFQGSCDDRQQKLNWVSKNNEQIKDFVVQKSDDGVRFENIAIVEATSKEYYEYTDYSTADANYYRIGVTGNDGTVHYSKVININCSSDHNIWIYPNPTRDILQISADQTTIQDIRVLDINSRIVKEQRNVNNQLTQISLSDLPAGVYAVLVSSEAGTYKSFSVVKE